MRLSHPDILMIEAFIDGELPVEDIPTIQNMMETHPELKQVYEVMKIQRSLIKSAFLSKQSSH